MESFSTILERDSAPFEKERNIIPAAIIRGSSMSMRVMSAVVRESALSTIAPSRHSPPRMPGIPIPGVNISQTIRMSPAIRQMRAGVLHPII